jgi:hypothetical protein
VTEIPHTFRTAFHIREATRIIRILKLDTRQRPKEKYGRKSKIRAKIMEIATIEIRIT